MILADKIIELRKKNGWSQEELAHQLGVSRQAVSKWESASSIPDLDKILKLSQVFGVSTDYLLKDEMELEPPTVVVEVDSDDTEQVKQITLEEATTFLELKLEGAKWIALAVAAMVLSPELLIFLGGLTEYGKMELSEDVAGGVGIVVLLGIVGCAVAGIILISLKLEKYECWQTEMLRLEYGVEGIVRKKKDAFEAAYRTSIAIGVFLCILCAVPILIGGIFQAADMVLVLCVNILLALVAAAVFLFVWSGIKWEGFAILLQEGDYSPEKKRERRKMNRLGGIYWCLVTALYLGISFYTNAWHRTWIIWPCAGVLYAAISGIVGLVSQKNRKI